MSLRSPGGEGAKPHVAQTFAWWRCDAVSLPPTRWPASWPEISEISGFFQGVETLRRCLRDVPSLQILRGSQITWKSVPFRIQPDLEDGTLMTVETSSKVPKVSAAQGLLWGWLSGSAWCLPTIFVSVQHGGSECHDLTLIIAYTTLFEWYTADIIVKLLWPKCDTHTHTHIYHIYIIYIYNIYKIYIICI